MSFVHLHVHTHYSLLDGYSLFPKLIKRVKDYDMSAVAITDHGTMYGVIEFYNVCNRENIHPIIGMEGYITTGKMTSKDPHKDKRANHLLLIAENIVGYKNLLKIASASQLQGFYYQPRIDHDFLAAHSEGLITTSGCLRGVIPDLINQGQFEQAEYWLRWYLDVFGKDNFFIELQDHDISELKKVNVKLVELGQKHQARFIATNDVHYVDKDDARYQDILLAIQTGALLADTTRMKMDGDTYYLRSPAEMAKLFQEVPESISNTQEIADRCDLDLSRKKYHLPNFEVPQDCTDETFLRDLCDKGLKKRYGDSANNPEVLERLEYELKIIHDMGFDAYFLIVWDLCKYARENNIWYEARGSAAGSIVAYALDITLIEPLSHGLIFERFLNPARVNMPDIDLDFQDDKRADVMQYCAQKYGSEQVAQIITFGTIKARQAIRDVGRVMDVPLNEVDKVAKLIPNVPSHPVSIPDALKEVPELRNYYENVPYLQELIDTAAKMEGVVRNAGTHAAGVVISDIPLVEYVPLHRPTRETEESPINTITQFEMSVLDDLGMLKVDFLGLSTLTVMSNACQMIQERHGVQLNLGNIPLEDKETFDFLGKGLTAGVFQLEGAGMTRYLVQMKPHNLDNIIAMVALYRPGPMQFIPSYIARMHGKEEISYRHELLRPILEETYGIAIYQEQIMSAAIKLAGYTASESDKLRKIIAKKKENQIAAQEVKFIKGSVANGIEEQTARIIFEDWKNFAQYGFNKSHAADYGVIAVQTAYLKTHYPLEFMTALLCGAMNDSDKVAFYINDCHAMGIDVLPPDVNFSKWDFSIEERDEKSPAIRFGFGAVKNVGQNPVEIIVDGRSGQPFEDINDFVRKIDLRKVGRRALECLVRVGALDGFGERRAILTRLERMIAISESHYRAKEEGQLTFFGTVEGMKEEITLPDIKSVNSRENLEWEKELLGLYLTDHPLRPYINKIKNSISHYSGQLKEVQTKQTVKVAGLVTNVRPYVTRKGDPMGFATIEDLQGTIDLVVFPRAWKDARDLIELDEVLIVTGKVDNESFDPKILVNKIEKLIYEEKENNNKDQSEVFNFKTKNDSLNQFQNNSRDEIDLSNHLNPVIDEQKNPKVSNDDENNFDISKQNANSINPFNGSVKSSETVMTKEQTIIGEESYLHESISRKMTIIIQSSGKKEVDIRLLRQVHGILNLSPGNDRFAFICRDEGKEIELDFPNNNIKISNMLIDQIHQIVGIGNVVIS